MTDAIALNEALTERLISDLQQAQADADVLRQQNAQMQALIVGLADKTELKKMLEYFPQLTHLNNSTSVLASNVQHVNTTLASISTILAGMANSLSNIAQALKPQEAEET